MKLSAELGSKFVDEFADGESFGDVSRKIAGSRQMPDEQRKNLVRIDERAIAVDGADAVAISIGAGCTPPKRGSRVPRISSQATPLRRKSSTSKPAAEPCMTSETKRSFAPRSRFQSTSFSSVSRYGARGSRGRIRFFRAG